MGSPLVGVWELESDTHQGLTIHTETHRATVITEKGRGQFSNEDEPTEAEEAAAYRTLSAGAGTYSVSGSVMTFSNSVSRTPHHADDKKYSPLNLPSKVTDLPLRTRPRILRLCFAK